MGTGSDFDVRILPPSQLENGYTTPNGHTTQTSLHRLVTKAPKTTTGPRSLNRGPAKPSNRNLMTVLPNQGASSYTLPGTLLLQNLPFRSGTECQLAKRKTSSPCQSWYRKPLNAKKLHVNGNSIKDVTSLISPSSGTGSTPLRQQSDYGNNQGWRIPNLTNLRRLYLNGNQIERLIPRSFQAFITCSIYIWNTT